MSRIDLLLGLFVCPFVCLYVSHPLPLLSLVSFYAIQILHRTRRIAKVNVNEVTIYYGIVLIIVAI